MNFPMGNRGRITQGSSSYIYIYAYFFVSRQDGFGARVGEYNPRSRPQNVNKEKKSPLPPPFLMYSRISHLVGVLRVKWTSLYGVACVKFMQLV